MCELIQFVSRTFPHTTRRAFKLPSSGWREITALSFQLVLRGESSPHGSVNPFFFHDSTDQKFVGLTLQLIRQERPNHVAQRDRARQNFIGFGLLVVDIYMYI